MIEPINNFVDAMVDSQEQFERMQVEIERKDKEMAGCIRRFQERTKEVMSRGLETEDEELSGLYNRAQESLGLLLDTVAADIEKTQKGMEFIKKYEQSFNVAVFGKVKAGKSYLGNFVMGNQIRDMGIATSYDNLPRPVVEVYDRGKVYTQAGMAEIKEDKDGFVVDPNEATSAIQLFRLGALTWFDTPGIGSVTWENEMLAKDYVDNADLVIFTSNSDAAGTRQDFAEMAELHSKGKPFLLLLTQSDTLEEDFDEETGDIISTLTAKSAKDRQDTQRYMVDTLMEQGMARLKEDEILTISAMLAITALEEQDEERFQDSHMGDFLKILTDITRNEGAELKRKTPAGRINAAIVQILKRLEETEQKFGEYQNDLERKQKALGSRNDMLLEQMKQQCRNRMDRLIRRKTAEVEQKKSSVRAGELEKLLSREIYKVLLSSCAGEFASGQQILSDYAEKIRMEGMGDLEMKKDRITYTVHNVERRERDPDGILEHIGSFFGKKYYKTRNETQEKVSEFDIGVNEQQILNMAYGQLNVLFDTEVPKLMQKIGGGYLMQITGLIQAASRCIQETKTELESLKCPL